MSKLKKNKTLPVHIVEQHNDVVPFIHRAIASKLLQFTEIPIIHLDSHPDLLIPINMQADLVFQPQSLFQSISIENWLLPLAYAKHISHIVWVKPPWANQIQASEQEFTIGKSVQSGKIRLSCKENYFLTDGLFSKVEGLTDTSKVKLTVVELAPKNWEELPSSCAASSSSSSDSHSGIFRSYKEWTHHIQDAVQSKPYILDIDLDFFSTANPFKNWLGPEEEEVVRQLYHCPSPSDLSDEMEFWNPPQPSVTHDPRQNKRQGPNIIDSFGEEITPMLLTRQKEPVSILVTENAHMGEELGQDGTELATAIVQAKIDGDGSVQKLPVVEVEHRTYHAGCCNRKCWMWFFIFLLQFTGKIS
ncbi:UPF0489 protein C5orf22 homolog [Physella acuta]|uniref:UPF0489 protein C5orf22 homolog n=1 Tax=Physella acuta TaxID=109671 RepID=UPI0027DC4DAB|nr:UPF0489 protein C5orf22 homolog [Physella acuta]